MEERRKCHRFKVRVPVEIHADGYSAPMRYNTTDLSLEGCYIETLYPLPRDTHVDLRLEAGDTLLISGTVITSDPQFGNGIHFDEMLPEDFAQLSKYLDEVSAQESDGKA